MFQVRRYTEFDCDLLRELTGPHKDLLLSKNTEADSKLMKRAVWETVFTKYNETEHSTKTTLKNLKKKWDRLLEKDNNAKTPKLVPSKLTTRNPADGQRHLTPQVKLHKLAKKLEKPATSSVTPQTTQSKPVRTVVKNIVSTDEEQSVLENNQRPTDREQTFKEKLLLSQLRYHKRKLEIMELEHLLKKEIMEIKKKKLNFDNNADCNS